ncbi:alpha/beta fold hydrolase [Alicyclobacillus fastidiosus]|uniref:Alpha/beta fold hydrolase n=1 Tax=Alicyclobacillus fastidiosus TaxID=392011 RepID=A0ABY6ZB99_9BACL|nr:alpha/beta fold hydrolase [Alicyclobacillus fastidiosus]WAH39813.1 alpha/beta fold hydrolase [Alicyclobacillus fastidiosus]GMA61070.1 oxidoreductase [Alicyclobacillus fastidiosus]
MEFSPVQERQTALSHGVTHYLEAGEGEPLILLHGVGFWTGGDYWLPNIVELSRHFHVFSPDFVGWGKGDRLSVEYSFAYLVDFVREFQDALGISSAHIVGHSMGGWVAALLAYESPHRVRTLSLVGSGGMSTRTLSTMTQFQAPTREAILAHATETIHDGSDVTEMADVWYQRTLLPGAVESYRRVLNHMNNPVHRARYHLRRRLPHIQLPTLVVWGAEDKINDVSMGQEMHALIPNSQMVVIPGGHYCPSQSPEPFNQQLIQFIRTHARNASK